MEREIEFGQTTRTESFLKRNPDFFQALSSLSSLLNKCFAREIPNQTDEYILFGLGHRCRDDFIEIVLLAMNQHGDGAQKILRSLYERAVTLAFLCKYPEKIRTFAQFAHVQDKKLLDAALKVTTEKQWDSVVGRSATADEVRNSYEEVKSIFQKPICKECGKRPPMHWGIDFASMVEKIGGDYRSLYLPCYSMPTNLIHATLASARIDHSEESQVKTAEMSLTMAMFLITMVVKEQNSLFSLKLDDEIAECFRSETIMSGSGTAKS